VEGFCNAYTQDQAGANSGQSSSLTGPDELAKTILITPIGFSYCDVHVSPVQGALYIHQMTFVEVGYITSLLKTRSPRYGFAIMASVGRTWRKQLSQNLNNQRHLDVLENSNDGRPGREM